MFETNFSGRNKIWGALPQKSPVARGLKCRLPIRISCDVLDRCFCKVETRACETLSICAKCLGGLAVTILPGASRSFNPPLLMRRARGRTALWKAKCKNWDPLTFYFDISTLLVYSRLFFASFVDIHTEPSRESFQ